MKYRVCRKVMSPKTVDGKNTRRRREVGAAWIYNKKREGGRNLERSARSAPPTFLPLLARRERLHFLFRAANTISRAYPHPSTLKKCAAYACTLARSCKVDTPACMMMSYHAQNKIAASRIPFSVRGFWDKNTVMWAGAMPYRRYFPATTRI